MKNYNWNNKKYLKQNKDILKKLEKLRYNKKRELKFNRLHNINMKLIITKKKLKD